jgi:predicted peptidase
MPSDIAGKEQKCPTFSEPPFMANCGIDVAGMTLKHILPKLTGNNLKQKVNDWQTYGQLKEIDQTEFKTSELLDDTGYLFVPNTCEKKKDCNLHVVLHGCSQGREVIGTDFVTNSGYLEWAASNDIVLLFP